ncbi:O-antigen ligase family protein [Candidatus Poribacteria bacterium]|nr:O-antigen ligase family protein [Candidatus Poribacteria bacterium]
MAMIFVAITPFILSFLFDSFGYSAKLLALAGAYFCIHGFYLTNSRGGFLGLIAVLFTYIYFKFKSKIGILAGVLLCIFLFFAAAPSRMHIIDDPQESTRGRIVAWYSALGMIRYHNPLFGVGKGQFIHYNRVIAHNAFVQQVGETGLVGAFFWLGFIYVTVKGIAEVFRKEGVEKSRRAIYRSYLIGLVGLLTVTMFISADHELWYVWMAFCSSIIVLEEVKVCFKLRDMFYIGLLEIMFILVVYGAVVVFENIYV